MFTNFDDQFSISLAANTTNPYADPFGVPYQSISELPPTGEDDYPGPWLARRRYRDSNIYIDGQDQDLPSYGGSKTGRMGTPQAPSQNPRPARDPLFALGQGLGQATGNFLNSLISGIGSNKGKGARMYSDGVTGEATDGGSSQTLGLDSLLGPMSGGNMSAAPLANPGLEPGFGMDGSGSGFGSGFSFGS